MLNRKQILEADDLKSQTVNVPEWGGDIRIRVMSGVERDEFLKLRSEAPEEPQSSYLARAIVGHVCGEDGKQLFTAEDLPALAKKSNLVLQRVFSEILKVNGIGPKAEEELQKK